jgi:hypothetical protein
MPSHPWLVPQQTTVSSRGPACLSDGDSRTAQARGAGRRLLGQLLEESPEIEASGRIARVAEALPERTRCVSVRKRRRDEHYTIPATIGVMIRASSPESARSLNCAISAIVNMRVEHVAKIPLVVIVSNRQSCTRFTFRLHRQLVQGRRVVYQGEPRAPAGAELRMPSMAAPQRQAGSPEPHAEPDQHTPLARFFGSDSKPNPLPLKKDWTAYGSADPQRLRWAKPRPSSSSSGRSTSRKGAQEYLTLRAHIIFYIYLHALDFSGSTSGGWCSVSHISSYSTGSKCADISVG